MGTALAGAEVELTLAQVQGADLIGVVDDEPGRYTVWECDEKNNRLHGAEEICGSRVTAYGVGMWSLALLLSPWLAAAPADPAQAQAAREVLQAMGREPVAEHLDAYVANCAAGQAEACAFAGIVYRQAGDRDGALHHYRLACEGGYWFACNDLVAAGDEHGYHALAARHRPDCEAGSAWACDQLGLFTRDDEERAMAQQRGCELGSGPACYTLALGARRESERYRTLIERACNLNDPNACEEWELLRATEAEFAAAEAACEHGEAPACAQAASLLETRDQLHPLDDYEEKRRHHLLKTACKQGAWTGCTGLGRLAERQDDDIRASRHYRQACEEEDGQGCRALAYLLRFGGEGVASDPKEALSLLERSCDDGEPASCADSADLVLELRQDRETAARRLQDACSSGVAYACTELIDRACQPYEAREILPAVEVLHRAEDDWDWRLHRGYLLAPDAACLETACQKGDEEACRLRELAAMQ